MPTSPPRRQRILITGASSGLGAQLARIWAADGRDLALCARRRGDLEALQAELRGAHPDCTVQIYPIDVTDGDGLGAVFQQAIADLGGLDRVVANAGIGLGAAIGTGHPEDNRRVLETNVLGTFNTVEHAVSAFRQAQAGHLVLISSMSALRGLGGALSAYSASKAALANLGEAVRSTVWEQPITVSTIFPGYIDTALNENAPHKVMSVDLATGSVALARAIDAEPAKAYVPSWPWAYLAPIMRVVPLGFFRRIAG
jgi:NAD(P)-dependent dehydrogenase (short-subunit alcohol dehydrogenase family)